MHALMNDLHSLTNEDVHFLRLDVHDLIHEGVHNVMYDVNVLILMWDVRFSCFRSLRICVPPSRTVQQYT